MLRIAILYEDNNVLLEFSPEKFHKLLKNYFEKYKDIDKTLEEIIKEIKSEIGRK